MLKLLKLFNKLLSLSYSFTKLIIFLFISLSVIVAFSEIALVSLVADLFANLADKNSPSLTQKYLPFPVSGGVIIIFVAVIVFLLRVLLINLTARMTFKTGANLIIFIYETLIYQDLSYFGKDDKSRHIAFLISKVEIVIQTLLLPILNLISASIISFIFLIYIAYISPSLSLAAFFVIILAYGFPVLLSKRALAKVSRVLSIDMASQVHNIKVTFEGIRDIKIWNIKEYFIKNVNEKSINIANAKKTNFVWSLVPRSVIEAIIFISIGLYLIYSSDSSVSIESNTILITFFLALLKVLPSFQQAYYSWQNLRAGFDISSELERYFNIARPNKIISTSNISFSSIKFENIDFSYKDGSKLFKNFNFDLKKGQKLAIFGESGCGKSTFLDLIAGINRPDSGEILLNDKILNASNLNPHISYISQDPFLFDMSIIDNVTLSFANGINVNYEKLEEALIKSGVRKYMDENELSLDYIIGENGSSLSGGQAQRIAIARALYSNKELILLDEALSALDSTTRDSIINELLELEVAIILITHDEDIYKTFPLKMNFKTKLYEN